MSNSRGLSKADREIIGQGSDSDFRLDIKKLFRGEGSDEVGKLPGGFEKEPGPSKGRGRSVSAKPLTRKDTKGKGRMLFENQNEEKPNDQDYLEKEKCFGVGWDKPRNPGSSHFDYNSNLDWNAFHWKPQESAFLRGISNWEAYKEALILQLRCIGYEPGMRLTYLDEIKLAAVIHRTTVAETVGLVSGIDRGTIMMRTFEATYKQAGELQEEALWSDLIALEYGGGCPVAFVTKFKTAVRDFEGTGTKLPRNVILIQFKLSVKAKSRNWHNTVTAVARFKSWTTEQLFHDFIAHFHNKIGQPNHPTDNKKQTSLNSTQDSRKRHNNTRRKWKRPGKGSDGKFRCWKCEKEGHCSNECPDKSSDGENPSNAKERRPRPLGPSEGLAAEYCEIADDELSSNGFAAQIDAQAYDKMVEFYDAEMSRRRGKSREITDETHFYPHNTSLHVTQQILSAAGGDEAKNRWLFDTGADIDATNNRHNLKKGTIVELKTKQFPIQTGNGIVYAECVGEVWLALHGPNATQTVMRLKYVVFLKTFPLNIVSGERFYRSGGRLDGNKLISPTGTALSFINAERRGFFLWLFDQPEPLKLLKSKKTVHYTNNSRTPEKENNSHVQNDEVDFRKSYDACWSTGIFNMSDDVMKKLVLWHRRLCHPSADRLRWTIQNTVGIDLNPKDVESLPCEACDMGKSVKHTTKNRRDRMTNVGEGWHCDIGTLNPLTMEGYGYFCLTTEDLSRYRIFKALTHKNEAARELRGILTNANMELKKRNLRVKRITIDGGRDWGMSAFDEFAANEGIEVIISAPDNQN